MKTVFIPALPTRYDKATGTRVPTIDTNPAASFGPIQIMFDADVPREEAIGRVRYGGTSIGPDDYILAVGDISLLVAVIMDAVKRNGHATLLRWQSSSNSYYTEEVSN